MNKLAYIYLTLTLSILVIFSMGGLDPAFAQQYAMVQAKHSSKCLDVPGGKSTEGLTLNSMELS